MEYDDVSKLQYALSSIGVLITESVYEEKVKLTLLIPVEQMVLLLNQLQEISAGRIELSQKESVLYAHIEGEIIIWKQDLKKEEIHYKIS